MAAQYTAIAFLYPRPEKLDRVMEIMGDLITIVKENEPDTITYEWYKSVDHTGSLRLTIIERYTGREAFDVHCANPKLSETLQKAAKEDLVIGEPMTEVLDKIAGFTR